MELRPKKMLTLIAEAVIEAEILEMLRLAGIGGYTIDDVRGQGRRGVRRADWEQSRTVRFQIVDEWDTLQRFILRIKADLEEGYALFMFVTDAATVEYLPPRS